MQSFYIRRDYNFPGVVGKNDSFVTQAFGNVSQNLTIVSDCFAHLNFDQVNHIPNAFGMHLDLIFSNVVTMDVKLVNTSILNCNVYHPALTFSVILQGDSPRTAMIDRMKSMIRKNLKN